MIQTKQPLLLALSSKSFSSNICHLSCLGVYPHPLIPSWEGYIIHNIEVVPEKKIPITYDNKLEVVNSRYKWKLVIWYDIEVVMYFSVKRFCCCCSAKAKNSSISWVVGISCCMELRVSRSDAAKLLGFVLEPGFVILSAPLIKLQGVLSLVLLLQYTYIHRYKQILQVISAIET